MKKTLFGLIILCFPMIFASAQTSNIVKTNLSQAEIDRIVKTFTDNEGKFREALKVYAFNRNAMIATVGMGGQISGVYQRDSFLTFKEDGTRFEKILYAPVPTIKEITVTAEDIDNLGGIDPFAIEPQFVANYNFTYLGKEKIDELDLYVFDVAPKVLPDWKKTSLKYFSGRIWVDDRDLMIVKSKGKAVPEGKQRFPIMETWRDNVDGKYWFPALSTSDDTPVFDNGQAVKMRVRVSYKNYRVGRTEVIILDDDEPAEETKPTPTASPTPTKKP
ncbi:MAG TPA: hypothetical protein PKE69_02785 [Pyrinomonadaceae bacterium]|nr:hypothetical protein [Pyrinomonadaceae bacterium]